MKKTRIMLYVIFTALLFTCSAFADDKKISRITCGSQLTVYVDRTAAINAKAPSSIVYASNDKNIAQVDPAGKVTGISEGSVYIRLRSRTTRKYTGTDSKILVTVKRNPQDVKAQGKTIYVGDTAAIDARANSTMSYSSSDTSVVYTGQNGEIKGLKPGSAVITIKAKGTRKWAPAIKRITILVKPKASAFFIYLRRNDGTLIRKVTVGRGNDYKLPVFKNSPNVIFVGWSKTNSGNIGWNNPKRVEYPLGTVLENITSNMTLYSVYASIGSMKSANAVKADYSKYEHVIFVGDSRTLMIKNIIKDTSIYDPAKISFICRYGRGLEWFKHTAYPDLIECLERYGHSQKPAAVILNLGVNDLTNYRAYAGYLPCLADALKKYNCKIFYVSVNPYNSTQISEYVRTTGNKLIQRNAENLYIFNNMLKNTSKIAGYTYIDTCSWLLSHGFSTKRGYIDDGLHYSDPTSICIYNLIIAGI